MTHYLTDASNAFNTLYTDIWTKWVTEDPQDGPGLWHMANTLDCCIDYVAAAKEKGSSSYPAQAGQVHQMIQDATKTFTTVFDTVNKKPYPSGYWFDDWGWWANAFIKTCENSWIFQHGSPSGEATMETSRQYARDIWDFYSTYVCNSNGCFSEPPTQSGEKPSSGDNSVTNSLYLLMSARLCLIVGPDDSRFSDYLSAARKQYQLFEDWRENKKLLDNVQDPAVTLNLVRWGADIGEVVVAASSDWVWVGNQGLLLAGLVSLNEAENESDATAYALAKKLSAAARDLLFDKQKILHEAPFRQNYIGDPIDYATGKGVFLRYLAESEFGQVDYKEYVVATANGVTNNLGYRGNPGIFKPGWGQSASTKEFQEKFLTKWKGESPPVGFVPFNYKPLPGAASELLVNVTVQTSALDALTAAVVIS